jgi:hypothetical protein
MQDYREHDEELLDTYTSFTITRNPYDRAYSCWNFLRVIEDIEGRFGIKNFKIIEISGIISAMSVYGYELSYIDKRGIGYSIINEFLKMKTKNIHFNIIHNGRTRRIILR